MIETLFVIAVVAGKIYQIINNGAFPNIPLKTMGGKVFWDNIEECAGWKLQRNVFSGHYRILNPDDVRRAWGKGEDLERIFKKFV